MFSEMHQRRSGTYSKADVSHLMERVKPRRWGMAVPLKHDQYNERGPFRSCDRMGMSVS